MITRLHHWWQEMRVEFLVRTGRDRLGAVGLAAVLIGMDVTVDLHVVEGWPLLFGAGAAGARGLLTAVASSMITVAGVVFSITIVALSLTSSQYMSRVLRNFIATASTRWCSVCSSAYSPTASWCSGPSEGVMKENSSRRWPCLAVDLGVRRNRLSDLLHSPHLDVDPGVEYYRRGGTGDDRCRGPLVPQSARGRRRRRRARRAADVSRPTSLVSRPGTRDRLHREYRRGRAARGRQRETILAWNAAWGVRCPRYSAGLRRRPRRAGRRVDGRADEVYTVSHQRTVEHDAAFGLRQIVDIALKALSPGINDTTTAVMCVDYLAAILVRLAARRIATSHRLDQGELRVIARGRVSRACWLRPLTRSGRMPKAMS